MQTDEINARAAEFKPPFVVTRQSVDQYRKSRKVDLQAIKRVDEINALTAGYALKEYRVMRLSQLAEILAQDVFGGFLWTEQVKGVGSGDVAEIVEFEEFNKAEVDAYRGVLDDIAAETGGRAKRIEGTGADGAIVVETNISPEQIAQRVAYLLEVAKKRKEKDAE